MSKEVFETRSLKLVHDIQEELSVGLNSLGGKKHRGLEDQFPFYSASHINRAVEGYVLLRQQFRLDACQFAHAAFRAITGDLDELYTHDNRTMALCPLTGLDAVASLSGSAPNVEAFRTKLSQLHINVEE